MRKYNYNEGFAAGAAAAGGTLGILIPPQRRFGSLRDPDRGAHR
jgi:TRAP-type mannitol/chloroaromatic compound transport system permease large subunit